MPLRVRFTLCALVQLDDLHDYIHARNPERAPTYIRDLKASIAHVATSPFPLALAIERGDLGSNLRALSFGTSKAHKRIIVLEITDTTLTVVRVLGGSMDLLKSMKEETP